MVSLVFTETSIFIFKPDSRHKSRVNQTFQARNNQAQCLKEAGHICPTKFQDQ